MSRYNITPEPRRLWLSMLGRISVLKNDPMFASVLDRHMTESGVRNWQTLDNLLGFLVAIESETEAIVQDQSGISGQSNQSSRQNKAQANAATTPQKPQANAASSGTGNNTSAPPAAASNSSSRENKDKPKPGPDVCKHWNTKTGCRYGAGCRNKHPYAKVTDGLCFICGAQEHRSSDCPRKDTMKAPASGSSGSKSGTRSNSQGKGGGKPKSSGDKRESSSKDAKNRSSSGNSQGKGSGKQEQSKPGTPRGSNSAPQARALSAAVDLSMSEDALLDSGVGRHM
eukprot:2824693-Amphidinium_carterae.2